MAANSSFIDLTPQEVRHIVESSGRIHMREFQIVLGVLDGFAILCFIARIFIRLYYQKRLQVDDGFLILALMCLCAATGIIYHDCYFLYLHTAALHDVDILPYILPDFPTLLVFNKLMYVYLALIWTTTFSVKWCFLIFFRPLVWHLSRAITRYYWFVVIFCTLTWAFLVAGPFIICPYFGVDNVKCFVSVVNGGFTLSLTALFTILDILSDIMIISIPIIVLKGSQLSRSTKFGLIVFLCLSIFMIIFAIIRISGFRYHGLEDDTWEFFWQQAEGAIAVIMASLTAFRTLFVRQADSPDVSTPRSPVENFYQNLCRRFQALARANPTERPPKSKSLALKLPKLPAPTFTGIRTFIRRNNQSQASTVTFYSEFDPEEMGYHAALKTPSKSPTRTPPRSIPRDGRNIVMENTADERDSRERREVA